MKVWVLTSEVNSYDQYGEYFIAVFAGPPHHTKLFELGVPRTMLRHVLNGGGRAGNENTWYHLRLVDTADHGPTPHPSVNHGA